jgi:phosphoglycerate dehydrogenase-like enzyme
LAPKIEALIGRITPAICVAAPKLRWVQADGAGMDKVLTPELITREEVIVTNMAGLYAVQVAEHVWALLLALARGIGPSVLNQQQGLWKQPPVVELKESILAIIGMGGIGSRIAERALGFDMTVLGIDPVRTDCPEGVVEILKPTRNNLHSVLARADAVVCSCPLTAETHHLMGTDEFACMRQTAFFINIARGGIVDEAALIVALENSDIAAAAIDVCQDEPLAADHPLWQTHNLLITPHNAGNSPNRQSTIHRFFGEQLRRYLTGEKLHNIVGTKRGF